MPVQPCSPPRRNPWLVWGILALLPGSAAAAPPQREFWRPDPGVAGHPVEVRARASFVASGAHLLVYREEGYVPGAGFEAAAVDELITAFDATIHPRLVALFGPPPDIDHNGAVIVLITRLAGEHARFWRFNQLPDEDAQRWGFHSNEAEILFTDMGFAGNRRGENLTALARAYAELLLYARDPAETAWSRALAAYAPFLCGLASARLLWEGGTTPVPEDPSRAGRTPGLWLPVLQYLRERAGDAGLAALATNPKPGLAALDEVVRQRGIADSAGALFADAALAAWLDDRELAQGRFTFREVNLPRAREAVRVDASRASAGSVTVPAGSPAYLRLQRSGERAQPLTLQGQPEVSWVGRAVLLRPRGPDVELPLSFSPDGIAHLDLSPLQTGEEVIVAVISLPAASPTFDRRLLQLHWGLGWVPRLPGLSATAELRRALAARFPDGGTSATASLSAVMARLTGLHPLPGGGQATTRYAWAPEAARIPDLLLAEAAERRLPARRQPFLRVTPTRVAQEWTNVLIELPGSDPRRWPVVLAAHWDAGRTHVDDSYAHALGAHDNASGVAVALEAAGAIARAPRRAPVVVAFLAGGRHGAAGAQALLDELQGRVAAWIELDAVGVPEPFPNQATVTVEGEPRIPQVNAAILKALREQGLVMRLSEAETSAHTGASAARHRGIAAAVLRTTLVPPAAPEADLPAEVDLALTSPELMALLARAVASVTVTLAGPAPP